MNQSVYARMIYDALFAYDSSLRSNEWGIHSMGHIFKEEMNVSFANDDGSDDVVSDCMVKFYENGESSRGDGCLQSIKDVIGTIEQNEKQCFQFRVILKLKKESKSRM